MLSIRHPRKQADCGGKRHCKDDLFCRRRKGAHKLFRGRGYVFGFRSLMSGSPYAGSLIAHSRCTVYKIPMEAVREKLLGDPEFMQIVFRGEYERGRAYSRKCEMLTLSSAKKKIICVILSLYNKIGYEYDGKKCLSFNITHEQLSEIIYSDRVTVSRIMSELKKSGYIEGGKSDIVINDYDKLYEMLSQN